MRSGSVGSMDQDPRGFRFLVKNCNITRGANRSNNSSTLSRNLIIVLNYNSSAN